MNLVCTSCIKAAEYETWSAGTGKSEPADLCMSLGAQMDAHDCNGYQSDDCACAYPHDGGLMGNDPIRVLELGRKYARAHGHNAIAAEGMHRAICRALDLLAGPSVEGNLSSDDLLAIYNGLQAQKEPNTNNLVGIRCPKCGSYEPFTITFGVAYTVYDNMRPTQDGHLWPLDADIKCAPCGHTGIVGEFQQNQTVGETMNLKGKEKKGGTTTYFPFSRDFGMRTSAGNEAVALFVRHALESIEQGRVSNSNVLTAIQQTIEMIHAQHPEVTSVTVRDYIFNALAPAYRKRYKVSLSYDAVARS